MGHFQAVIEVPGNFENLRDTSDIETQQSRRMS